MSIRMALKKHVTLLVLIFSIPVLSSAQSFTTHAYPEDATNFANPERGFYKHTEALSGNYNVLSEATLNTHRGNGYTLLLRVFYLQNFLNSPISAAYLENVERDFAVARKAGFKIIVRFAYTQKSTPPYGDATPARVLQHIEQLKPLLRQNGDVIALMQAGFIGAWGEWYYTDHFSAQLGNPNESDWANRRAVVQALLQALPTNRAVQVRTPQIKRKLITSTPAITTGEAFTGTSKARLGHHNDCFLASPDDYGTYINLTEEKAYLEEETKYLPMGGETCAPFVPLSECPNALAELKRFHWSYLNRDYHPTVLNGWTANGCMDEVEKQLGYRYRLTETRLQNSSKPGGAVTVNVHLVNEGWANPYNPRPVELILKNATSGKAYRLLTQEDPRRWSLTDTIKIELTAGLPVDMEQGSYEISLHLPDPAVQLKENSMYAIRLANANVWSPASGYNNLGHTVVVSNTASVPDYTGTNFFLPTENPVTLNAPSGLLGSSFGNNVLLYWGITGASEYRIIERSLNGTDYEQLAILAPDVFSFVDRSLTANATYFYRSRLTNGNQISEHSNQFQIETKATQPPYYTFTTDGLPEEWEATKPVASVYSEGLTHAFRLSADKDSVNILVEGSINPSFKIYFDTDNDILTGLTITTWQTNGFDYALRNDSVFRAQSGNWIFVEKTKRKQQGIFTEISIRLGVLLNLNQNLLIRVAAEITPAGKSKVYLPLAGEPPAVFLRALPPAAVSAFTVANSPNLPETQLVVSWQICTACTGYVLERSEQATPGFEPIATLARQNVVHYDNTVTTGKKYYYRIYAFSAVGISENSEIVSGTPQVVTSITGVEENVKIYPNPASDYFLVSARDGQFIVDLADLSGRKLHSYKMEVLNGLGRIDLSNLASGLYFVAITNTRSERVSLRLIRL
ncbi:MAG: DUF4832 domain-containing protein [Cytophagales bacterium]|nr:DUF4832 domain-containing protein [Cytophagales bacterium]